MKALRADTVGSVMQQISCECIIAAIVALSGRGRGGIRFGGQDSQELSFAAIAGQRIGSACRRA
eukprot:1153126-Pleurochrysis_carterae.AAC.2